jgi:hypothetical protein
VTTLPNGVPIEPLVTFARSYAINGQHIGWLFGAGASASAGIPTAGQLLDEFKAELYASACNLDRSRVAMADPLVAERVRTYYDGGNGLPAAGAPDEYAVAFELAYPEPAVRRQCLDGWIARGRPSFGHRVVAALMAAGHLRWLATTNFDDLPERAYEQRRAGDEALHRLTVAAIDSAERAARALREDDWPLLIKLHGDIASDRLKNTTAELQRQDEILRQALLDASRHYGLAVIGYSGRDDSVMDTLRAALETNGAFPHGLVWLTSDSARVLPAVLRLLEEARVRGVDARFVEAANFDEAFGVITRHVRLAPALKTWVDAGRPSPRVTPVALPATEAGRFPALRLNALPVLDYPRAALRIRCRTPVPQYLRPLLRAAGMPGIGIASSRTVLGFGVPDGWRRALADFGPTSVDVIDIDPGADGADSQVRAVTYDALVRSLARDRPLRPLLRRFGHRIVVSPADPAHLPAELVRLREAYGSPLTGTREGGAKRWSEGVELRLEWRLGRLWLLFEPWTFVEDASTRGSDPARQRRRSRLAGADATAVWVKERWATRRNTIWAAALGAWADVLIGGPTADLVALGLGDPNAVDARFRVASQTAFSLPASTHRAGA